MKKLFSTILVISFMLSGNAYAEEDVETSYLICKGKIPIDSYSDSNTETFVKIDYKNSRLIFGDGKEYISKFKWDNKDWNFESLGGVRTDSTLEAMDHEEYFSINRFTGKGVFYYGKTKKSNWKKMTEKFNVICFKAIRSF